MSLSELYFKIAILGLVFTGAYTQITPVYSVVGARVCLVVLLAMGLFAILSDAAKLK